MSKNYEDCMSNASMRDGLEIREFLNDTPISTNMKYVKETINSKGRLVTTEITREEALHYLSEDQIADIIDNDTAREMGARVTIEVDNAWVGIQF